MVSCRDVVIAAQTSSNEQLRSKKRGLLSPQRLVSKIVEFWNIEVPPRWEHRSGYPLQTVVIILFDLSPIVDARKFRMGDASVFRNFAKEILAIDGLKAAAKEPRKIEAETREFLFLNVRHFHDDVGRR